jgi:3-hydroxyacyl-CoA dehydrogenase
VEADIEAGETMIAAPLPAWVFDGRQGVHAPEGSWSATDAALKPRSTLPVYGRQLYPEQVLGEAAQEPAPPCGRTKGCACGPAGKGRPHRHLSFKSKMHAIGDEVLDGVLEAVPAPSATWTAW